jgi:hypothetical protein
LMGPSGGEGQGLPASDPFGWSDACGAGSRAGFARDPAPLRYVGVRPIDLSPIDGPPSSAHSGRNRGGRTIGPGRPCGPGALRAYPKTNLRLRHCPYCTVGTSFTLPNQIPPCRWRLAGLLVPTTETSSGRKERLNFPTRPSGCASGGPSRRSARPTDSGRGARLILQAPQGSRPSVNRS